MRLAASSYRGGSRLTTRPSLVESRTLMDFNGTYHWMILWLYYHTMIIMKITLNNGLSSHYIYIYIFLNNNMMIIIIIIMIPLDRPDFFRNPTEIEDSNSFSLQPRQLIQGPIPRHVLYISQETPGHVGTTKKCVLLTYWMAIKIYLESAYLDSLKYRSRIEGQQMNSFFKPQKWSLVVLGHIKTWTFPTVSGCPEQ